ncbi:hypothetical protein Bca4012_066933 [Brassica carinata]
MITTNEFHMAELRSKLSMVAISPFFLLFLIPIIPLSLLAILSLITLTPSSHQNQEQKSRPAGVTAIIATC